MANKKLEYYESKLRQMIMQRRKVDEVEAWLEAAITASAMNWMMLEKLHEELMKGELISFESGSQGQHKKIANPLLVAYKECQRSHILNMEALGLNYKIQPAKMREKVSNAPDEDDPLIKFYKETMDIK